jgi:hypothetical protein
VNRLASSLTAAAALSLSSSALAAAPLAQATTDDRALELSTRDVAPFTFEVDLQAYASDMALANLAVKVGGDHFYGMVLAGMQPTFMMQDQQLHRWSLGLGAGAHLPLAAGFSVDGDLSGSLLSYGSFVGDGKSLLGTLRVMAAYRVADALSVFAGPTLNTLFDFNGRTWSEAGLSFAPKLDGTLGDTTTLRVYPGFVVGVQL